MAIRNALQKQLQVNATCPKLSGMFCKRSDKLVSVVN